MVYVMVLNIAILHLNVISLVSKLEAHEQDSENKFIDIVLEGKTKQKQYYT